MKKCVFGILTLYASYSINAQDKKVGDCILLITAIKTDVFQKHFFICNSPEVVSIIDTAMYFKQCSLFEVCNKNLILSYKLNDSLNYRAAIVIYRVDYIKHTYSLYFYCPHTGASLHLKLRYKNSKARLLSYEVGAF